jgi:hypothetical protein
MKYDLSRSSIQTIVSVVNPAEFEEGGIFSGFNPATDQPSVVQIMHVQLASANFHAVIEKLCGGANSAVKPTIRLPQNMVYKRYICNMLYVTPLPL